MKVEVWMCEGVPRRGRPCGTYLITPAGKDFDWTCPIHKRNTDLMCLGTMELPQSIVDAQKETEADR